MAHLHVVLLPASHPAAYHADVLLRLLVRVLRLLHLLLQLHPVDQGLLELSARHQRAHVLEADRRLLGGCACWTPRMLLRSHVMVHREVHVFLQFLLEPLYLLLPLLQNLLLLASLLLELGLEGLDLRPSLPPLLTVP